MKAKKEKTSKAKIEVFQKVDGEFKCVEEKLIDELGALPEIYGKSGIPINLEGNASEIGKEIIFFGDKFESAEPPEFQIIVNDKGKIESPKWIAEIETLCNEQGILPEDMVREWKEAKEKIIELEKKSKNDINQPIRKLIGQDSISTNTGLSKWQLELRKKKLGI